MAQLVKTTLIHLFKPNPKCYRQDAQTTITRRSLNGQGQKLGLQAFL